MLPRVCTVGPQALPAAPPRLGTEHGATGVARRPVQLCAGQGAACAPCVSPLGEDEALSRLQVGLTAWVATSAPSDLKLTLSPRRAVWAHGQFSKGLKRASGPERKVG